MRFRLLIPLLAFLPAMHPGSADAGNLVKNPSFETGTFSDWTVVSPLGFTQIGDADYPGPPMGPHSGNYYAWLGDVQTDPGSLSQRIQTKVDGLYTFSFWLEVFNGGRPPSNNLTVRWDGVVQHTFTNLADSPYTSYTYTVRATSANSIIQFDHQFNDGFAWGLDDVSVVALAGAVPEPSTLASAGVALCCALLYRSRRRNAA